MKLGQYLEQSGLTLGEPSRGLGSASRGYAGDL